MPSTPFTPQIVSVVREGYTLAQFRHDLLAGIITGIVALPLAVAFAIASGVPPERGLYTAIIAGFLISLLSGSRVQIGGPTGAYIVIVAGIVHQYGLEGLTLATVMAGGMLLIMGVLRFGSAIRYIPYPVTLGFTSGIAIVIASSQFKDAFGLPKSVIAEGLLGRCVACVIHMREGNPYAIGLTGLTLLVLALWPRFSTRMPASIIAVIIGTAIPAVAKFPIETIGGSFGTLAMELPSLNLPTFSIEAVHSLFPAALSIAMLGAIESLLSAVVADGMTGGRHRSNMELIAQGVANLVTPLFGGIPATGAIARTATNIRNGGRTPIAGMLHALVLLILVCLCGTMAERIPLPVLAGVLLGVAWHMSEARLFLRMFRAPKSDAVVMILTFLLTVFLDLTVAIPAGMVMASFLFMMRMEAVSHIGEFDTSEDEDDPLAIGRFHIPPGVQVYEIQGPFFFGAAHKVQTALPSEHARVLILRMRHVSAIDATGLFALEALIKDAHTRDSLIVLSGLHDQPATAVKKLGLLSAHCNVVEAKSVADALMMAERFLTSDS